jgi:hypothetical protein
MGMSRSSLYRLLEPEVKSHTLADRFAWLIECLFKAIGFEARRRQISHALEATITHRLFGLWRWLRSGYGRWRADTLRPPRPRKSRADGAEEDAPTPALSHKGRAGKTGDSRSPSALSRKSGWLKRLLPDIGL